MDSNVSKNTNSHNFFKLEVEREKLGISIKNLLKQELLLILSLYQQKFNIQINLKSIASILLDKIIIYDYKNQLTKQKSSTISLVKTKFTFIVYSCPIGLLLEANLRQAPSTTMQQITQLVSSNQKNIASELSLPISIEIVDYGWINFYLSSKLVAFWLQRMLDWHQTKIVDNTQLAKREIKNLENTPANLFPAQYIHARCCSLLNLGTREKLDLLINSDSEWIVRHIEVNKTFWLDETDKLWLTEPAERNLLQQLSIVADSWNENASDRQWQKLLLNLTQATAIFLADCRFLGEVKQKYPQLAIARLGLILLVKIWLEEILQQKLGVAAPKSL